MKHFIFGYGSLICSDSRSRTGVTKKTTPCFISHFQRAWNVPIPEQKTSALGVFYKKEAICNGVIIEIEPGELTKFDEREIPHGYARVLIDHKDLAFYDWHDAEVFSPTDLLWVYVHKKKPFPIADMPIVQSYLDVVLNGCLNISEEFAQEFLMSTDFWNKYWINDRENPRYVRPLKDTSQHKNIDRVIKEFFPEKNKHLIPDL